MSAYLPDGCTQDALDRHYGYDQPNDEEPQPPAPDPEPDGWMTDEPCPY